MPEGMKIKKSPYLLMKYLEASNGASKFPVYWLMICTNINFKFRIICEWLVTYIENWSKKIESITILFILNKLSEPL